VAAASALGIPSLLALSQVPEAAISRCGRVLWVCLFSPRCPVVPLCVAAGGSCRRVLPAAWAPPTTRRGRPWWCTARCASAQGRVRAVVQTLFFLNGILIVGSHPARTQRDWQVWALYAWAAPALLWAYGPARGWTAR